MSSETPAPENKAGRFPGFDRLWKALVAAAFFGAGSVRLLGGGVAMSITAGVLAAVIYLREVVRGGTSWRELLLLVPAAAAILVGLHFILAPGEGKADLGPPHVIGIGGTPRAIAASPEAIWIVSSDGTLSTIGPTGIRRQVHLQPGLGDVAFGFRRAWVARGDELAAVNAGLHVAWRKSYGSRIAALAPARRGVWMLLPAARRIDLVRPASGQVRTAVSLGHARAIAADSGHLWVARAAAGDGSGSLVELDESGRHLRRIEIGAEPRAIALDSRYVWISYYDNGDLTRVTRATGDATQIHVDSSSLAGIALRPKGVWAIDEEGEDLVQVDPDASSPVGSVAAGGQPLGVAFWRSSVFVVSGVDGLVRVFPITVGGGGSTVPGLQMTCS